MPENVSLDLITYCSRDYFAWIGEMEPQPWHPWFDVFHSVDEVISKNQLPGMIVISLAAEAQDEVLEVLRSRYLTSHCLIFVCHESALSPYLANGLWLPDYDLQYQTYLIRRRRLRLEYQDDNELKLISYLWLHGNHDFVPHGVPNKKQLYDYPLLKCWQLRSEESLQLLQKLKDKRWIETDKLFNRVRFCPSCGSGHINYLDVCPDCHGADIVMGDGITCEACHYTDINKKFHHGEQLICPKCHHHLDHDNEISVNIGHCLSCDCAFKTAKTQLQCLHCHSHNKVEDSNLQTIYSYQLAPTGKTVVRQGQHQVLKELKLGETLVSNQFYWLIKWQNQLALRHKLSHIMLSVSIKNLEMLMQAQGELTGLTMMDSLQKKLNKVIRDTDACSHYTADGLLLFLPMTKEKELKHICQRLFELQPITNGDQLQLTIKALFLPAEMGNDVSAWVSKKFAEIKPITPM